LERCRIQNAQALHEIPFVQGTELEDERDRGHSQPVCGVRLNQDSAVEASGAQSARKGHDHHCGERGHKAIILHDQRWAFPGLRMPGRVGEMRTRQISPFLTGPALLRQPFHQVQGVRACPIPSSKLGLQFRLNLG
jgi:hypothetical protein